MCATVAVAYNRRTTTSISKIRWILLNAVGTMSRLLRRPCTIISVVACHGASGLLFRRGCMKLFLIPFLLSYYALAAEPTSEDHAKAAENPGYYVHVMLTGVVKQMIFPGPPNFESVEEGDFAEPRTILEVDDASLLDLVAAQSRVTPNHYLGEFMDLGLTADEPNANLVTLDSFFTEEPDNIELDENKIITIDAVLSAQPTRCHTPFVVEIVEVLSHE